MLYSISTTIAKFVADLKFENLPKNVVHEAKKAFLDFLGVALAGCKTEMPRKVVDVIMLLNEKEESTIIGHKLKTSMPWATFANTTISSYLELDDLLETHPGAIIMPAALSVGENFDASGKKLLTAIVAGYEVQARISKATSFQFYRGIDPCGSVSAFGSATTTAKLLNLNLEQISNSIEIAGCLTPLSCYEWLYYGSFVKTLEMAQAAKVGVLSAFFAQMGIDGPPTLIEGKKGFCQASTAPESYDLNKITESLGISFEILRTFYKSYASCAWTHEPIEAVLSILERHPIRAEEIDAITVRTHKLASELSFKLPRNELQAKFSIPYTLAVAILYRKVWIDQFTNKRLKDPIILGLSQKVDVIYDAKINKGAVVEVSIRDGKKFSEYVERAHGYITDQNLKNKFLSLATRVLNKKKAERIVETVANLEKIHNIGELIELLP